MKKRVWSTEGNYTTSLITIVVLVIFLAITLVTVVLRTKQNDGEIIAQDVATLAQIFERINERCTILSFDYEKNPINFLTIKKDGFVGSEVGSMNLAHPHNWEGPYLRDNPTIQGKEYQVVRTRGGYYIVPGDGVKLPNGKVVGKSLVLDKNSDITTMMGDTSALLFEQKPLAAPLVPKPAYGEDEILAEELV